MTVAELIAHLQKVENKQTKLLIDCPHCGAANEVKNIAEGRGFYSPNKREWYLSQLAIKPSDQKIEADEINGIRYEKVGIREVGTSLHSELCDCHECKTFRRNFRLTPRYYKALIEGGKMSINDSDVFPAAPASEPSDRERITARSTRRWTKRILRLDDAVAGAGQKPEPVRDNPRELSQQERDILVDEMKWRETVLRKLNEIILHQS